MGYLFFIVGFITLLTTTIHLPTILATKLPDDLAIEIGHLWGTPNWPRAIEGIIVTLSIILLIIATIFILIARRRFGAGHIIRVLIAVIFVAIAIAIVLESTGHIQSQEFYAGQPFGVIFEQICSSINDDILASLFFFIPAIILLVWPPKRKPPQVIALNQDAQIKQ